MYFDYTYAPNLTHQGGIYYHQKITHNNTGDGRRNYSETHQTTYLQH
jgi:hypothetical protein